MASRLLKRLAYGNYRLTTIIWVVPRCCLVDSSSSSSSSSSPDVAWIHGGIAYIDKLESEGSLHKRKRPGNRGGDSAFEFF